MGLHVSHWSRYTEDGLCFTSEGEFASYHTILTGRLKQFNTEKNDDTEAV